MLVQRFSSQLLADPLVRQLLADPLVRRLRDQGHASMQAVDATAQYLLKIYHCCPAVPRPPGAAALKRYLTVTSLPRGCDVTVMPP
jgi:hypothetical protein